VFNAAQQQQPTITPAAFAEAALGLKLDIHETLLGLHLVAGTTIPGLQAGIRLAWAPTSRCLAGDAASAAAGAFSRLSVTTGSQSSTQGSAGAAPVSAVGLFMDLKQAYRHFVEAYLEPIAAASSLSSSSGSRGSSTTGGSLGGVHWESKGSPVTLVHLLTLVRISIVQCML